MNKLFGLLILPLLACSTEVAQPTHYAGEGGTTSNLSTIGFHDAMDWRCHQEDYNENLVWIECKFTNTSARYSHETCIRVILKDAQGVEVDHTRLVCSSNLAPGATYENYASFFNSRHSNRRTIVKERCGLDTSRCTMTTKEFPRE